MINSRKSLLSAFSLLAMIAMASQPALSTSTDEEDQGTSTSRKSSQPEVVQEEQVQSKTASQALQDFKSGLTVGAALSAVKQAFEDFKRNFEVMVNAPRTFSGGLEGMQQFMVAVKSVRDQIQSFSSKLSEYDELGVEKLTEKSRGDLQFLLPQDMNFLTGNTSQQSTQPLLVQEEPEVGQVAPLVASPAVVEEDPETYDKLMSTPQGRLKLRNEALALVEQEVKAGNVAPKASSKLGGLFSGFESGAGMSAAIGNLKKMINQENWDDEYKWPTRGWVKKHNLQLIELMKVKLEGPLKQKYTPKN